MSDPTYLALDTNVTFELHLPTLLALTIGTNLLLAGFMGAIYQLRQQACFAYWGLSCLLFAIGCALASARALIDAPTLTVVTAYGLLVTAPLLAIIGLLSFMGLAWYQRGMLALVTGLIGYLLLLAPLQDNPFAPRMLTALYTAMVFALAYHLAGQLTLKHYLPMRVLRGLFAVHGGLMLVQAAVMSLCWSNDVAIDGNGLLEALLVSHILLTISTALTFPLLEFVQSENHLRRLAEIDDLTQALNRRAFFSRVSEAFADTRRRGAPFSILMIDLDHFKQINDKLGHATGDQALRFIGRLLKKELRERDLVGRIGGEEFAVALPDTSDAQARSIASRLCECIAERGQQIEGRVLELTASIGGAHARASHPEFNSVLMEADNALYTAKATGRNTVYFQPLPPEEAMILNLSDRLRSQHVRQHDGAPPCA